MAIEKAMNGTFKPIYMIGHWNDPADNHNKCCSVAILMNSGTDKYSDFSLKVVQGRFLEYTVKWPEALTDPHKLHAKWLQGVGTKKLPIYHPMILAFQDALPPEEYRVRSRAMIPLGMTVENRFETHPLAYKDTSTRVLYVTLRARKINEPKVRDGPIVFDET